MRVFLNDVSSSSTSADKITQALGSLKIRNITVGGATAGGGGQTLLFFKPFVPQSIRQLIVNSLNTIFSSVNVQENSTTSYDLVIDAGALKIL